MKKMDNYLKENIYTGIGIFTYFMGFLIPFIIWIVYPLWEFEVLDFSDNKDLYLSEKVVVEDSIFLKYHKINFKVIPENQLIIQMNKYPLYEDSKYKSKFGFLKKSLLNCAFNKNVNCKMNEKNFDEKFKNEASYYKSLPSFTDSIVKLKDCVIHDDKNWLCKQNIKNVNLSFKYFGLKDGSWILNDEVKSNFFNWKIYWYLKKIFCNEICYKGSKKEAANTLEYFMKRSKENIQNSK